MADKKLLQVFEIVKDLADGKEICLNELSSRFDVSVRTIQRYINDLEEIFGKECIKKSKRGCFVAINREIFSKNLLANVEELNDFEKLADIISITNPNFFDTLPANYKKVVTKIKKEISDTYLIKENPFEEFENFDVIHKLKNAIKYKQYVNIDYNSINNEKIENIKPLKIVFMEGNLYLACLTLSEINSGFKFLRVSFIESVEVLKEGYYIDYEAESFLKTFQTPFSRYKEPYFEVILEVSCEIKRHFLQKKFLK
ncbi:MAG: WYL domain-containing protein, partial [Campylobacterales bacterium]|nr:WYL domain-containing protein [Campylobacterales bacterium]